MSFQHLKTQPIASPRRSVAAAITRTPCVVPLSTKAYV